MLTTKQRWYLKNREREIARAREWVKNNPERAKKNKQNYIKRHPERRRESSRKYDEKVRLEVLNHYGGSPPRCACCGEMEIHFLSIDHIKGGGRQHKIREHIGSIYDWLRSHKFPDGFRILCHNCNQAIGAYGACPHQQKKENIFDANLDGPFLLEIVQ